MKEKKEQLFMDSLNVLKLIAILLVVIGHSTNQYTGNWIYKSAIKSNLYEFISIYVNSIHMQIFVFVSGIVYCYGVKKRKKYGTYKSLVKEKFVRLVVPYIFVGLFFVIPIGIILGIDKYKDGYLFSSIKLLTGYYSGHLWFLLMLFMIFLIFGLVEKNINKINWKFCVVILFILQLVSNKLTSIFYINKVFYYAIFFYLGYLLYINIDKIPNIKTKKTYNIILFLTILGIISILIYCKRNINYEIIIALINLIISLLGILQMYNLTLLIDTKQQECRTIQFLKKNSFNIYLFHEPIIFIILSKTINFNASICVLISFLCSIIGSIIVSKIVNICLKNIKFRVCSQNFIKSNL
ncbi:MAG: acyltransferase [Paeniclostridium sordellii]|uniref:acyltransferase family protein n=1 Tax=Paraclostridium sordellii TaxID=1505 RepID=UPI0005DEE094|nr:acyltransferase [Paeniclostridium sordellii]MBS6025321.1 acyltransferase [Paeniclostridium sordellii]CEN94054.1 putative acyltransferase [[Clostridium] sordellii] [Paeniclostridium sordellii]CEN96056.1 putative acyltransferase [[Clostridium] sordellii] [Paeniclostridium sordellii]